MPRDGHVRFGGADRGNGPPEKATPRPRSDPYRLGYELLCRMHTKPTTYRTLGFTHPPTDPLS